MIKTFAIAPPWSDMRPVKGAPPPGKKEHGFPVYEELETKLAAVHATTEPDVVARHVCAALAGWAYSDAHTVAIIASRLGLQDCRVRCFDVANNGMLIRSTSYLVQSADGRVVLLAYRGTDPFDVSTWAVDADVNNPAILTVRADRQAGDGRAMVHAGFYRNQRATWFEIAAALMRALSGKSILDDKEEAMLAGRPGPSQQLEALYVTGHSLGAAMATIAAYKIAADPAYAAAPADFSQVLKQVYLFAPPMVGNREFGALWDAATLSDGVRLNERVFAHTYARDVVPHLPPRGKTKYVHVGKHYGSKGANEGCAWSPGDKPEQCSVREMAHAVQPLVFGQVTLQDLLGANVFGTIAADILQALMGPPKWSFADHSPTNYVVASQPRFVTTEFGDDF